MVRPRQAAGLQRAVSEGLCVLWLPCCLCCSTALNRGKYTSRDTFSTRSSINRSSVTCNHYLFNHCSNVHPYRLSCILLHLAAGKFGGGPPLESRLNQYATNVSYVYVTHTLSKYVCLCMLSPMVCQGQVSTPQASSLIPSVTFKLRDDR